jgi:hypothetical protein
MGNPPQATSSKHSKVSFFAGVWERDLTTKGTKYTKGDAMRVERFVVVAFHVQRKRRWQSNSLMIGWVCVPGWLRVPEIGVFLGTGGKFVTFLRDRAQAV